MSLKNILKPDNGTNNYDIASKSLTIDSALIPFGQTAKFTISSNQATPNAPTEYSVLFDNIVYNNIQGLSQVGSNFRANEDMVLLVNFSVFFANNAIGYRQIKIFANGINMSFICVNANTSTNTCLNCSAILKLNNMEVFDCKTIQSSGANIDLIADLTQVQIYRLY